jgi:glycine/D-amino acid oxidase-like deaminating enzyme
MADAVVVGGGFYGSSIAYYLKTRRGLKEVILLERDPDILMRASFVNQARVHGGYHYPRSFTTAFRSRVSMPRFRAEFGGALFQNFTSIYAMARRNSRVTVKQMERFCREIGARLEPAERQFGGMFNRMLIERVWLTEEDTFDADALRQIMWGRLREAGVATWLRSEVCDITDSDTGALVVGTRGTERFAISAPLVFNCTYSRLQRTARATGAPDFRLRHELAELVLVEPPPALASVGVTVMDGPFFSTIPFPARKLHSLTHVRYTPHISWHEDSTIDPYRELKDYQKDSGVEWMIRDARRYLPCLAECRPVSTLFEVKTVLLKNEGDDGRPILFERHGSAGRIHSVLGGKIDNIYDILQRLDEQQLPGERAA